jgi:hypothetical protein
MIIRYENILIRNAVIGDSKVLGNWWRDGTIMEHAGFPNTKYNFDFKYLRSI